MTNQLGAMDQEYERLYGEKKKVQLLDMDEMEYQSFRETVFQQSKMLQEHSSFKIKSDKLFDNISILSEERKRLICHLLSIIYDLKQTKRLSETINVNSSKIKKTNRRKNTKTKVSKQTSKKNKISNLDNSQLIFYDEFEKTSSASNSISKKTRTNIQEENNILATECGTPIFYIKVKGKCDASGYYNVGDNHFYIKGFSLVSNSFNTLLENFPVKPLWKEFVENECSRKGAFFVVNHDVKLPKASLAATFVLGRSANNVWWRDRNGRFLKDYFPDRFALTHM